MQNNEERYLKCCYYQLLTEAPTTLNIHSELPP